jgi:diphthamide biosynthesis protein 2
LKWRILAGTANASNDAIACQWIGPREGAPALTELLMSFSGATWSFFDPLSGETAHGVPDEMRRRLMRRFFLLEKAREAAIVGLLVGTLAPLNISEAVSKLRRLAQRAGKRTYTVIMGKPNPYKLANFPEVRY